MALARTVCIVVGAAALAALSASFALGRVTERHRPLVSAALPTVNGIALAGKSGLILAANMTGGADPRLTLSQTDRAQAIALARRAYAAEPLAVTAVRNVGLIAAADGDRDLARTLMRDAARLSRRDLAANVWLIRDFGERGNVAEALAVYDHALRTSSAARTLLLPAMLDAMTGPELVAPLIDLLDNEPPWADAFWREAPKHPPALITVAKIRIALAKQGLRGDDARNLALLRALADQREFAAAERLFDAVAGRPKKAGQLLRNESFEHPTRFEPFDWRTFFDTFISADVASDQGTLRIDTFADGSGVVARQLVALQPGEYRLAVQARDWDALDRGAIYARLRCAEQGSGFETGPLSIEQLDFTAGFSLPNGGCGYYWLELLARQQPQRRDNTVILDSVKLYRATPGG